MAYTSSLLKCLNATDLYLIDIFWQSWHYAPVTRMWSYDLNFSSKLGRKKKKNNCVGNSVLPIKKYIFGGQCKWQAAARLCVCSILLYSIRIQTNVFLLHKWIMMVLWIWQVRMTLQAKTIAGMLQYGELVVLGGGGVKISWMSTRCGVALDNSTGVFITTGFLWDSVPFEIRVIG